jgi:hypothetical protein
LSSGFGGFAALAGLSAGAGAAAAGVSLTVMVSLAEL